MIRRLLRAVYYALPRGWLPWAWRLAAAEWLLGLDHNLSLHDCVLEEPLMGGKPQTHTPADRRLSENKHLPPHQPAPKPAGTPVKPTPVNPGKK